jgi:hypothetical protein
LLKSLVPFKNIAKQITLGTTLIISNLEKMTLQHTFKHIVTYNYLGGMLLFQIVNHGLFIKRYESILFLESILLAYL